MLLLARTRTLYASYLSTFSEVAWWLGGATAQRGRVLGADGSESRCRAGATPFRRTSKEGADPYLATRDLVDAAAPVIFDVGANVGADGTALPSALPTRRDSLLRAVRAVVCEALRSLSTDAIVSLHRLALSSARGSAMLNVNRSAATELAVAERRPSRCATGARACSKRRARSRSHCKRSTVFCEEHSIARIDVLEARRPGAEYAVLEGADALLAARRIGMIYAEVIIAPTYVGQRRLVDYLSLLSVKRLRALRLLQPDPQGRPADPVGHHLRERGQCSRVRGRQRTAG